MSAIERSRATDFRSRWRSPAILLLLGLAPAGQAQVTAERGPLSITVEGYANVTAGVAVSESQGEFVDDDNPRVDAALRPLLRWANDAGPDVGVRIAVEYSPEDHLDLAEASVLLFGAGGRLELGERQGLPDVLLGYAPNNFTFTGAEFGPASGPSLDPGGGLQTAFLESGIAAQIHELAVLGFAASLSDDRSSKALYVSPKWRGWLAGVSYASDATDPRFDELVQAGVTHDSYWADNVLHLGGSVSLADAAGDEPSRGDLRSVNLGATVVLDYDFMLGASVTYDGTTGVAGTQPSSASVGEALGAVLSVNYNRGPWTTGAFVQWSTREGDTDRNGDDELMAFEAGLSYRLSTKLRVYGAWYHFDFDDEGGLSSADRHRGDLLLIGMRAAL